MGKYAISITETFKRTAIVEAENIARAIQKVEDAAEQGKIILDTDDYDGREIAPSEYWENGEVTDPEDARYFWHLDS